MIGSGSLNIINVYRSSSLEPSSAFIKDFVSIFDKKTRTLLVGDLNICGLKERNHPILHRLETLGFKQKIQNPTHIEGRQIDHVFFFSPSGDIYPAVEVIQVGQFFTDHDLIVVDVSKLRTDCQVVLKCPI